MWISILLNALLLWILFELKIYNPFGIAIILGVAGWLYKSNVTEGFDYMPDSHKTTCAKGSVPAGNGLDCKIPSDRFGL